LIDVTSLIFLYPVYKQSGVCACVRACRDAVTASCNYLASYKPTYRGDDFSRDGVP